MDTTASELHRQRGKLIDAFVQADELVGQARQQGITEGPLEVEVVERLAIRLLVKHFGWRMTAPGTLLKPKA